MKTNIKQKPDVEVTGLIYEPVIEEVKEQTLHEKFDHYIQQARGNFVRDTQYHELMQMLQFIQTKTGNNYPFNPGCATCVINMIQLFDRLR